MKYFLSCRQLLFSAIMSCRFRKSVVVSASFRNKLIGIGLTLFLFVVAAVNVQAGDSWKVQTRFRTYPPANVIPEKGKFPLVAFPDADYRIQYKTVDLKAAETALLTFDSAKSRKGAAAYNEMKTRIELLAKKVAADGGKVFRAADSNPIDPLKKNRIKNVLIAGVDDVSSESVHSFGISLLKKNGFNILLVRDLVESVNDLVTREAKTTCRARQREIFVEKAEKTIVPSISSSDLLGGPAFRLASDTRKHIVFVVSDDHYDACKSLPLMADWLMNRFSVYCSVVHGEGGSNFMSIDELDTADTTVVYIRRLQVPVQLMNKLKKNLADGRGLVGFRTSSHAFDPRKEPDKGFAIWPEFDKIVQGGNYNNHSKAEYGTYVVNVEQLQSHPILKDVLPVKWHSVGSLYFTGPIAKDATILQYGSTVKDKPEPLTWIRFYGPNKARVGYSGLGHPDDFCQEPGMTLMTNLILWSAGIQR